MILVDTSVWIEHLRSDSPILGALLYGGQVLTHPWVVGELSLGLLRDRTSILGLLRDLPVGAVAGEQELLVFIERRSLSGAGIGYADAGLLASTQLTPDAQLWTRDRRLQAVARRVGAGFEPEGAV